MSLQRSGTAAPVSFQANIELNYLRMQIWLAKTFFGGAVRIPACETQQLEKSRSRFLDFRGWVFSHDSQDTDCNILWNFCFVTRDIFWFQHFVRKQKAQFAWGWDERSRCVFPCENVHLGWFWKCAPRMDAELFAACWILAPAEGNTLDLKKRI